MVFSTNDLVLIKPLRQEKKYGAKRFTAGFPSQPWTLSRLNKLLRKIDTSLFVVTSQKPLKLLFAFRDLIEIWHVDCQ